MATRVKAEEYWRCNRWPWGCDKKHKTQEEAEACETATEKFNARMREGQKKSYLKGNQK